MRYLILNADDFGYSVEVNAAILRAHREGVLTSTSLMVAEREFEGAVQIARQNPALGVGLHLVLSNDLALLPPAQIPLLTDGNGRFGADLFGTGVRYAFSKRVQRQVRAEMEAQFARFAETGLPWSHVDGHQHFHLHPFLWDNLLDLCESYGIHRLRIPHEEVRAHFRSTKRATPQVRQEFSADGPNLNTVFAAFLRAMRRRNLRVLRERKTLGGRQPFLCDRVYGQLQTGNMHAAYTLGLLDRLGGRVNEIYFHPGAPHARPISDLVLTPDALNAFGAVHNATDVELHALLAPTIRTRIESLGLKTGTYAEVEREVTVNTDHKTDNKINSKK